MKYEKVSFSSEKHIEILKERGLVVVDTKRMVNLVGYFRLTSYMYHLQENDGSHQFKGKVSFDDILLFINSIKNSALLLTNI